MVFQVGDCIACIYGIDEVMTVKLVDFEKKTKHDDLSFIKTNIFKNSIGM